MTSEADPSFENRVEAYLDQLLVPLARNLSPFHQDELRRELRAHLWGRVEAYRELDYSEEDAMTEALRQFGGAKDFARQWRREWISTKPRVTVREVWESARHALRPSLLGVTVGFLPCPFLHMCFTNLEGSAAGTLLYKFADVVVWGWFLFAFLLMPLLVGVKQGRRTPECAGVGMLTALTAEIVAGSLLYELAGWGLPSAAWASLIGSYIQTDSGAFFIMLAAWLPVAGGAAAVSGWWTQRTKARQTA